MRIIAGQFGSRRIEAPAGMDTRPTLDKVREAVFSSLGAYFDGGSMLDLYAGSGANGLEALSRGMDHAVFVDRDRRAVNAIRKNIDTLQVKDRTRILSCSDTRALAMLKDEGMQFSLIYMDPPYAKQKNQEILSLINDYGLLKTDGTIVIESDKDDEFHEEYEHLHYEKDRIYGVSRITWYRGK